MLLLVALSSSVLVGIVGVALDGGRGMSAHVHNQAVGDAASLSAARLWRAEAIGPPAAAGPPGYPDAAVDEAAIIASADGVVTTRANACVLSEGAQLEVAFFDVDPGPSCRSVAQEPAGWTDEVDVLIPPQVTPLPRSCVPAYGCVEVDVSRQQTNLVGEVIGFAHSLVRTVSVASAALPPPLPPGLAIDATEVPGYFDSGILSTRAQFNLPCVNCPGIWNTGVEAQVGGFDWNIGAHRDLGVAAAQSAIVAQGGMPSSRLELCDTTGDVACAGGTFGGVGLMYTPGSLAAGNPLDQAYCAQPASLCTTLLPTDQGAIQSAGVVPFQPTATAATVPTPATAGLPSCGGLLLNGQSITTAGTPCVDPAHPYAVQPGVYAWIAINHGAYTFAPGVYDITGAAPVNAQACPPPLLGGCLGITADGIDHSRESTADFDLCGLLSVTGCPTLTAGVWIGHGSMGFAPAGATAVPGCAGSPPASLSGGGDATRVSGRGVSFVFGPASPGFVSTDEVGAIALSAPPLGTVPASAGGLPVLFDSLNTAGWIHLGGPGYTGEASSDNGFRGIVTVAHDAQLLSGVTGGGVEIDPGLAETAQPFTSGSTDISTHHAALYGQVLADSVIFYGHSGLAVDFQQGWGILLPPASSLAGVDPFLVQSVSLEQNPTAGTTDVELVFAGITALDGYTATLAVAGVTAYPSQGTWTQPGPPPPLNNGAGPSDASPRDPPPLYAGYAVSGDADALSAYSIAAAGGVTVSIDGDWVFGHQLSYASAVTIGGSAVIHVVLPALVTSTVDWSVGDGTTASTAPGCGNSNAGVAPPAATLVA